MEQKLYEITDEYLNTLLKVEESDGEIDEKLEEELDINENDLKEKVENYSKFIKNKENLIEARKKEIERLKKLNKSDENTIDGLKFRLKNAMRSLDRDKIETTLFKVRISKSEAVEIKDENAIPSDFKEIEQREKISKSKIKEHLKEYGDGSVEGAELKRNENVQIK